MKKKKRVQRNLSYLKKSNLDLKLKIAKIIPKWKIYLNFY